LIRYIPEEDSPFNEAKALALKVEAQKSAVSGDFEQALQFLNETQPLTAQPAKILATKGSVLYKLGNVESAIVAWQQALELDPNLGEVKRMMEWLEK
jgi:Flp pilus assembly protein TadD